MEAVAGSLYGNTYQMIGINAAGQHLSPLIHQFWQKKKKEKKKEEELQNSWKQSKLGEMLTDTASAMSVPCIQPQGG